MTLAGSDFRLLDDKHIGFVSAEGVLRVVGFQLTTLEIGTPVGAGRSAAAGRFVGGGTPGLPLTPIRPVPLCRESGWLASPPPRARLFCLTAASGSIPGTPSPWRGGGRVL